MDDTELTQLILERLQLFGSQEEEGRDPLSVVPELGPGSLAAVIEKHGREQAEKKKQVEFQEIEAAKAKAGKKAPTDTNIGLNLVNKVAFQNNKPPVDIQACALLHEISKVIKLSRLESSAFKSNLILKESCRVLEDSFWYVHVVLFDATVQNKVDKQSKQEVLLQRLCIHFAKFILCSKGHSDLVFSYYHYAICKAVILAFNKTFPLSWIEFTPQFIQRVYQILLPLYTGVAFDVSFHNQVINQLFGEQPLKEIGKRKKRSASLPTIKYGDSPETLRADESDRDRGRKWISAMAKAPMPHRPRPRTAASAQLPQIPAASHRPARPFSRSTHRTSRAVSTPAQPPALAFALEFEDEDEEEVEGEEVEEEGTEKEEAPAPSYTLHPRLDPTVPPSTPPDVYSFDSYATSPLITHFFHATSVPNIHRKLVYRTVQPNETKQNPESMYYKSSAERYEVPKQILEAYLEVKSNVENKRKKIQQNLFSEIAVVQANEREELSKKQNKS
eukprot:Phypoly_transcript_08137.p1 GENE.Phypoly_transcript_08137~~Phypoly_transcript_08137.p1  ORF type:complete len:515 (+),score=80.48 Phypoly_transcript_08137:39-1547(+)